MPTSNCSNEQEQASFNLILASICMCVYIYMVDWPKGKVFGGSDEIDQLTKTINEQSDEQRRIIAQFNKAMNEFAAERSLETCLDALNLSMQLANIRSKLAESYEYYARLLEREITRLSRTKPAPP
jgi:methyl-accepting chemotaxis protein